MPDRTQVARRLSGTVRVTMPASAIHNLDTFNKSIANLAEKLGHPRCFSGVDCIFMQERDFVVDPQQRVKAAGAQLTSMAAGPHPEPWATARPVTITLPTAVQFDLEQVQAVTAKVAGLLGCGQCHSGFDWRFRQELDFIVDQELNIHAGPSF